MQAAHLWIQPLATAIPSFPVHRSSRTSFSLRAPLSSPHPPSVSGDSSPLLSTTQTRKLNKYSSRVSEPKSQGGSQVILHGVRLSEDKPRNCIPSVWYEGNTFNMHLLGLSKDVREGASVREAGMVDVRFNTVRTAQWYDGNVSIPGCDKNDVAFFTDGRFSVASHGFFAGHICPEAQGVKGYRRNIDDSISISDATIAQMEASFYGLQIIPNADLEEMKELGSGAFGTVCHGKWRGTDVAVKRIKKSCFQGNSSVQERLKKDVWGEARMLSSLRHPNVVAFYGVVPDGPEGTLAIVTEFMPDGSLGNILLRKDRLLDRQESIRIALDAALGMEYLHLNNVVHFDIKCDNLLVNLRDPERPICKVGDFGLSTIKHNTLVSGGVRGTLPWMAPELLNLSSSRPSEKVDNYSFGIVMWEILTGEKPYANMLRGAVIGGVSNNTLRPPIPKLCDPEWKKLMEECWSHDPAARPSFTEITDRLRDMM